MNKFTSRKLLALFAVAALCGCEQPERTAAQQKQREADRAKVVAADQDLFTKNGFEIVASHAETISTGGNCYTLRKPDNNLTYIGCSRNGSDFVSTIRSLDVLETSSAPRQ